jgi:hypothetical protein
MFSLGCFFLAMDDGGCEIRIDKMETIWQNYGNGNVGDEWIRETE